MRQRVERFLQTRLRNMLMPATLGLGLALGGCGSTTMDSGDDGGNTIKKDVATADQQLAPDADFSEAGGSARDTGMTTKYMAQLPDAGADSQGAVALYMAPMYMAQSPDAGAVVRYMAQQPPDAAADADIGHGVVIYMAMFPEAKS
jgi:hypothetical protein